MGWRLLIVGWAIKKSWNLKSQKGSPSVPYFTTTHFPHFLYFPIPNLPSIPLSSSFSVPIITHRHFLSSHFRCPNFSLLIYPTRPLFTLSSSISSPLRFPHFPYYPTTNMPSLAIFPSTYFPYFLSPHCPSLLIMALT